MPDQRIEGGQQRRGLDLAGRPRIAMRPGATTARRRDRDQNPLLRQVRDRPPRRIQGLTEIVAQLGFGRDPVRPRRPFDQSAMRIHFRRRRRRQDRLGQDPFDKVIDPLKTPSPFRGRDVARPEQPLQRPLGVAPFPPAGSPLVSFEIRGRHGAVGPDAVQNLHGLGTTFARVELHPAPARLAAVGLGHAPSQERMQIKGDQGRLMRPVFEQPPLAGLPPGQPVQVGAVIAAQS
ncbi:hypothetical protein D3C80_1028740 [compost metagenome]